MLIVGFDIILESCACIRRIVRLSGCRGFILGLIQMIGCLVLVVMNGSTTIYFLNYLHFYVSTSYITSSTPQTHTWNTPNSTLSCVWGTIVPSNFTHHHTLKLTYSSSYNLMPYTMYSSLYLRYCYSIKKDSHSQIISALYYERLYSCCLTFFITKNFCSILFFALLCF